MFSLESPLQTDAWAKVQRKLGKPTSTVQGDGWSALCVEEKRAVGSYLYVPYGPICRDAGALDDALRALLNRRNEVIRVIGAPVNPPANPGGTMPAQPAPVDPHAGHQMPAATPGQADPHAGHDMSAMSPAQTDPHAGHDMSTMSMGPPDVATSSDNPGRPPEDPLPAAALAGPAHAADLVFGAEAMAASRRTLIHENGDVRTTAVILDRLEAGFGDDGGHLRTEVGREGALPRLRELIEARGE